MSTVHPRITIVDEQDVVIGGATGEEAWRKGLWHRIARIMLRNAEGEFLLQKRHKDMHLYPGCWDQSAGGHVDEGEDYDEAAHRELAEEIGVKDIPLLLVGKYKQQATHSDKKLNRFNAVYEGKIEKLPIALQPEEVVEVRWFSVAEVRELIAQHPNQVTDGLIDIFSRYYLEES